MKSLVDQAAVDNAAESIQEKPKAPYRPHRKRAYKSSATGLRSTDLYGVKRTAANLLSVYGEETLLAVLDVVKSKTERQRIMEELSQEDRRRLMAGLDNICKEAANSDA